MYIILEKLNFVASGYFTVDVLFTKGSFSHIHFKRKIVRLDAELQHFYANRPNLYQPAAGLSDRKRVILSETKIALSEANLEPCR